jgi:hypothetical protein
MSRRLRSVLAPPSAPVTASPAVSLMPDPLVLDLVAALVQGGASPRAALGAVGAALEAVDDPRGGALQRAAVQVGLPSTDRSPATSAGPAPGTGRLTALLEEALWLAARSGLPPTTLIRRCAAEERRRQSATQMRAVRRLEVLLVVPAGLCLLPAFVLLGVVPVVLDLILG